MLGQVLAGVRAALDPLGVSLVGGHTTTGVELQVGLAVTGELGPGAAPLGLAGLAPGDRLVLTKPLGSGVVLAADMQGRAPGAEVEAAHAALLRANDAASAEAGAPALPGALRLPDAGVRSTFHVQNGAAAAPLCGAAALDRAPRGALLFDPQTSGGLLFAVPADRAEPAVAALRAAGEGAAVIERIVAGPPRVRAPE